MTLYILLLYKVY